ncbi:hypothetical protein [Burkholderia gladioli]|uniref:hypothetical protein n=1 Tax=Burkholderia gladioli TaxID=28095 RepID=UPI003018D79A
MTDKYQVEPVTYLARRALDGLEQQRWRSAHDPEVIAYRKELEDEQMRLYEERKKRGSYEQRLRKKFDEKRKTR